MPSPFNNPVTLVLNVIAGVVDAFATVPANPLAETTDTLVTDPEPADEKLNVPVPFVTNACPFVPSTVGNVNADTNDVKLLSYAWIVVPMSHLEPQLHSLLML